MWKLVPQLFYSYNISTESSGPKGCPRKKLEHDFWGWGQNPKVPIGKKNLKDTLNNVKSNYKVQATELFQFQLSSMKYEHLKPKNADILEIKGQLKKVHCAKKS